MMLTSKGLEVIENFLNEIILLLKHTPDSSSISLSDILSYCMTATSIVGAIIAGVCAIMGIRYINKLKEKTTGATFSYWVQLRVQLFRIKTRLEENNGLINNLYSTNVRKKWSSAGIAPLGDEVKEFYSIVEETLKFMIATPDQMPAYNGWSEDYSLIFAFFDDLIRCDIREQSSKFRYDDNEKLDDRKELCDKICKVIDRLMNEMLDKQKEAEKEINKQNCFNRMKKKFK